MIMNIKFIKNIGMISLVNIISIFSSVILALLLPKILSPDEYGYYRVFTLYVGYSGVFCLGLIDGIVLKHGGENYLQLDRPLFRWYFQWYTLIHLFWFVALVIPLVVLFHQDYFLVLMIGINIISLNFIGYYQQISQIIQRFKEYSLRRLYQSIFNVLLVMVLLSLYLTFGFSNYKLCIWLIVLFNLIMALKYCYIYKEISCGTTDISLLDFNRLSDLIQVGFPLFFSQMLGSLLVTVDSQIVNLFFSLREYAMYSFAYSLVLIITVALSAISVVLYPFLKRQSVESVKHHYEKIVLTMILISFFMLIFARLFKIILDLFLPDYSLGTSLFLYVFPSACIISVIMITLNNFYKVTNKSSVFARRCLFVFIISIVFNYLSCFLFDSLYYMTFAAVIVFILWYYFSEQGLYSKSDFNFNYTFKWVCILLIAYYLSLMIQNNLGGSLVYTISYLIVFFIIKKNTYLNLKNLRS